MGEKKFFLKALVLLIAVGVISCLIAWYGRVFVANGADDVTANAEIDVTAKNRAYVEDTNYQMFFQYGTDSRGENYAYVETIRARTVEQADVTIPNTIVIADADQISTSYVVRGINANAFENYPYIKRLILSSGIQFIGNYAFRNCTNLAQITWVADASDNLITGTSNLQTIGTEAFYGCTALGSAQSGVQTIPTSVSTIGSGAFGNCPSIQKFNTDNYNNTKFTVLNDGILYSIESDGTYRLVQCPAGLLQTDIKINEKVRAIDPEAFIYCTKLKTVTIPDTVSVIREKAFYGCSALTSATLPKNATMNGEDIFGACTSLDKLIVYNTNVGNVFSYCTANNYPMEVHCTVQFYDGGTLLSTQDVIYGQAATAPDLGTKDGYTGSWDLDFSVVTGNLSVHAVWLQNFTVVFQDVEHGWRSEFTTYYGQGVTPPKWTLTGYSLVWDTDRYLYVTSNLTVNAVWLVSMTDVSVTDGMSSGTYQVGDTFNINNLVYKVTRIATGDNRVQVYSCTNKSATYVKIPTNITAGGKVFKVTNIRARVFQNMTSLKKAVIGANVLKIGTAAFYGCTSLKNIVIYSKKLTADNIGEKSFKKIYATCKVKVHSGYVSKYKIRLRDGGLPNTAKIVAM